MSYQTQQWLAAAPDKVEGIRVGGRLILSCIKTVRFADDQATLASSVKGLQLMMDKMQKTAGEYGMKINIKKNKGDENQYEAWWGIHDLSWG